MYRMLFRIALFAIICSGIYLKFNNNLENIPFGCDEFGYLNLAKEFSGKTVIGNSKPDPVFLKLIDTLRRSRIPEKDIEWMITPYAYYLIPGTYKIINQYPPGTSFLLSWFPIALRKEIFPAIVLFLLLLFSTIAAKQNRSAGFNWFDLSLFVFAFIMTITLPFITELGRVNSLGFTFGLLIAAGILLKEKPLWTCFLIGLTANFRIVDLLLLFPLIAFIPFPKFKSKSFSIALVKIFFKYTAVVIISVLPYLLYAYFLLGNPWATTYPDGDTAFSSAVFSHFLFYINLNQGWFVFHLLLIVILSAICYFKQMGRSFFLKVLLFPAFNFLFFIFHAVKIDYYPYASSFIILGICFREIEVIRITPGQGKVILLSCLGIAILMFTDGLSHYFNTKHKTFGQASERFMNLCSYDVVWGEMYPGSSEYVCNNRGFKYAETSSEARKIALHFLQDNKISQVILLKDNPMEKTFVLKEISSIGLTYHLVNDADMGELLVLDSPH